MRVFETVPDIREVGWTLISAEARNKVAPETFLIPSLAERKSLKRGIAANLLFDIETQFDNKVTDRGVHRMWVVVTKVLADGYLGVLDSVPGTAENLSLARGDIIYFASEHVCKVDQPPADFLANEFGGIFLDIHDDS